MGITPFPGKLTAWDILFSLQAINHSIVERKKPFHRPGLTPNAQKAKTGLDSITAYLWVLNHCLYTWYWP